MTPTLIVLALVALGVVIVIWATRKKSHTPRVGPQDGDTAWNDPVTPGEPSHPIPRTDAFTDAPRPSRDPQP
ncbi:MAG: hypothetical protein ACXW3K_07695 [Brevundimonas sp.]